MDASRPGKIHRAPDGHHSDRRDYHEFVTISIQTPKGAEELVFRVSDHDSGRIVAEVSTAAKLPPPVVRYIPVTYVAGHAGFQPFQGVAMTEMVDTLRVMKPKKRVNDPETIMLSIPLLAITAATITVRSEPVHDLAESLASLSYTLDSRNGRPVPRYEDVEYVTVTTETTDRAEGIVFRMPYPNTAAGLVAKINFAAKHAKGESPAGVP